MSLRYDVNFNRRTLEARARLKWLGLVRTLGVTVFAGSLVALLALYALLLRDRHAECARMEKRARRQTAASPARPILPAQALETIMAAKASPRIWADRLRRLAADMPDDGALSEIECGSPAENGPSPVRGGDMTISGRFPVAPGEGSLTLPLTRCMDALQADTTFRRGFAGLNLESSRTVSGPRERSVEFRLVAR